MTTKQKGTHTPGPWKVEGKDDKWKLFYGDGLMIAEIHGRRPAIVEDGYNACLIAAAPELLEASILAYTTVAKMMGLIPNSHIGQISFILTNLEKAIAKATEGRE